MLAMGTSVGDRRAGGQTQLYNYIRPCIMYTEQVVKSTLYTIQSKTHENPGVVGFFLPITCVQVHMHITTPIYMYKLGLRLKKKKKRT